jgi:hypothetical protein
LYGDIEDLITKEQCETIDKMNETILGKKTNYRAIQMLEDHEPVPIHYFMNGIIKNAQHERSTKDDD